MPFKSRSQLRTCYGKRDPRWNCDKWLKETPSVCCLPEKKGRRIKHRCLRSGERIKSIVQTGPRGGKFFTIKEKDDKGEICTVKVYLPRKRR
jgi:hypothetical protein